MSLQPEDTLKDEEDISWVEDLSRKKDMEKLELEKTKNNVKHARSRRSRLTKFLVFLLVAAVAAIVVLAVKLNSANSDDQDGGTVKSNVEMMEIKLAKDKVIDVDTKQGCDNSACTTPACVVAAAHIIKSMDPRVDPCEDFYEYACGGWMKSRELPADMGHYAAYSVLRNDVNIRLRALLEEENDDDIESVQNAKNLYQSCTNEELIETVNTTGYVHLMEEFGGWPLLGCSEGGGWKESQYDLADLVLKLQKYNNVPLISVWVGMDDRNNAKNVIFVDQIWLGLGAIDFYVDESHKAKKRAYRTLIYNTAVLLGSTVDDLESQVDDIVDFETNLAKILVPSKERRDVNLLYNPMTIAELQANFTDPEEFPNVKFDWLSFISALLELPDKKANITSEEVVIQQGIPYYKKLFPLLNSTPPKTVANYLIWRITKNRLNNMPKRFTDEVMKYKKALYGTASAPPRWKSCVRYLKSPFDMVLGRMFVERYFSKDSKTEVLTMIQNIIASFKVMVDELDWMDKDMKTVAKDKADGMVEVIGYPDYIFEDDTLNKMYNSLQMDANTYFQNVLKVLQDDAKSSLSDLRKENDLTDRRRWLTSPTTVNAFYHQQRNMISFPAGILQPTYFHIDNPRYLNYGGIGFMIGHEITHGFDDMGSQYDKEGNLVNWWKPEAAQKYKQKGQCFINQYKQFVDPRANKTLNAEQNQGENIADNGGTKETYRAYRQLIAANGGAEERVLPGLNFTQNQLFFMNFAQLRCDITRPDDAVAHILNGYHSPNRFRVIGTLQNLPEFSEVFNCPVGSYMNPAHKCAVW